MEILKPTPEMLEAVANTISILLASGTPHYGVAQIVWNMVYGHVQMIQAGNRDAEKRDDPGTP